MTLIVEDGTGLADAESYVTIAEFKAYHNARGNDIESLENAIIEQLLRKATDYMIAAYRQRWAGSRVNATQSLDFPRYNVPTNDVYYSYYLPNDTVPNEVKNACAELALKAIAGDLMADLTQGVVREKADVIEVEYDKFSPVQTRYSQIDAMLSVFFISANSLTARLVRS